MQKLLVSLLGLTVSNIGAFVIMALIWSLFGGQEFVGNVLLRPEYRTDGAVLDASVADIASAVNLALLISCGTVILTGAAWLAGIWLAHLDSPGHISRLRWLWGAMLAVGLLVEAVVLGYIFFINIAVLRSGADVALWLALLAIYFGCFFLSSLFTTPYIARPAVPYGVTTLPR